MNKQTKTTIALSVCTVLSAAIGSAQAEVSIDQSPFAMQDLGTGYMLADNHEGKCGEGKCGMSKMDGNDDGEVTKDEFMSGHEKMFSNKDKNGDGVLDAGEMKKTEGKCGEGKCGGEKKSQSEGKCGEGKCGANK